MAHSRRTTQKRQTKKLDMANSRGTTLNASRTSKFLKLTRSMINQLFNNTWQWICVLVCLHSEAGNQHRVAAAIFLPNKDYWGCIKTGSLSDDALIKLLLNVIPHFWPLVQWYSLVWNSKWFVVCSEDEDDLGYCDLVKHKIVTKGSLIPVNDLLQTLLLRFCLVAYLHPAQNSIGFAVALHFVL